jgi:hypothetical protein
MDERDGLVITSKDRSDNDNDDDDDNRVKA